MSSIYDAIIYFPKYPEPSHKDFDTLEEAVEAKRLWEKKTNEDVALCCPRCDYIQKAKYTKLTINLKSDNDPYNPRDVVVNRLFKCDDCENIVYLANGLSALYFKEYEEVHARPFTF